MKQVGECCRAEHCPLYGSVGSRFRAARLRLHCAHPPLTSRSLRPIPITGPASISAATSALVLVIVTAQQTRSAARLGPQRPPPFWVAGKWHKLQIMELLRHRCGGHVRLASQ